MPINSFGVDFLTNFVNTAEPTDPKTGAHVEEVHIKQNVFSCWKGQSIRPAKVDETRWRKVYPKLLYKATCDDVKGWIESTKTFW